MAQPPPDLYNVGNTHKLFFVSSVLLTLALVWMVWKDYDREWKHYQRDFNRVEFARLRRQAETEAARVTEAKEQAGLEKSLADAGAKLAADRDALLRLDQAVLAADGVFYNADVSFKGRKSEFDSIRYFYDEAVHHLDEAKRRGEGEDKARRHLEHWQAELDAAKADLERFRRDQEQAERNLKQAAEARDRARAEYDALVARAQALERDLANFRKRAKHVNELNPLYLARNAPGIDFVNPSITVRQLLIPEIQDDLNFTKVGKVERCHTCHLGIDNPNYQAAHGPRKVAGPDGKEAEVADWHFLDAGLQAALEEAFPGGANEGKRESLVRAFRSHPRLDLYLTSASPHKMDRVGCTVCHEGDGRSLTFVTAAHTADDDEQAAQWKEKYGWHPMHHWDYPMLARRRHQSACFKCHKGQPELEGAERWMAGRRIVERVGCFGCHKTEGFELRTPDRPDGERRVGPALPHLADKTTPAWAYQWILKPASFRPDTRMPKIFGHANMAEFGTDAVEIASVVTYLFHTSRPAAGYEDPPAPGDAAKGKDLLEKVGCLACHRVGADGVEAAKGPKPGAIERFTALEAFGPALDGVGSKTTYKWLYNWIRNPERYFPDTKMPNLRLSKEEAADIAAFLATLKNPAFEAAMAAGVPDPAAEVREIAAYAERKKVPVIDLLAKEYLEGKYPAIDVAAGWEDLRNREVWAAALRRDDVAGPLAEVIARLPKKADRDAARGTLASWLDALPYTRDPAALGAQVDVLQKSLAGWLGGDLAADGQSALARLKTGLAAGAAALAPLSPVQWTQLYIGERTIARQGCFGCHDNIRGFEKAVPIGVELSGKQAIGSKDILKFDFGFVDIPATRESWLYHKLMDPRQFDHLKSKTREEKLRMPQFGFTGDEAEAVVTFLASLTNVEHPPGVVKTLSAVERDLEKGRRLVMRNNCRGCHQLDLERVTYLHEADGRSFPVTALGWVGDENPEPDDGDPAVNIALWRDDPRLGKKSGDNHSIPFTRIVGERRLPVKEALLRQGGGILEQLAVRQILEAGGNLDGGNERQERHERAVARTALRAKSPPVLYGLGAKMQAPWLVHFLQQPVTLRPWLTYRMPTFGFTDDEAVGLVKYFYALNAQDRAYTKDGFVVAGRKTQQNDELVRIQVERGEDVDVKRVDLAALETEDAAPMRAFPELEPGYLEGRAALQPNPVALAHAAVFSREKDTLRCSQCHYINGVGPQGQTPEKTGPELTLIRDRARPDWLRRWLTNPSRFRPGTAMTTFPWGTDDLKNSFPEFLPGDGVRQVEAVQDLLLNRMRAEVRPEFAPPASAAPAGK